MFKVIKLLGLFTFLFSIENALCQVHEKIEPVIPFIHYTTSNGLPSNETYSTIKDHQGYIWIATDKGVSRYNGYEFKNFTSADGLIDNTIFKIVIDHQNRIWFLGFNKKLCYYENNQFIEYEHNHFLVDVNKNSFTNYIHDFSIDKYNNIFLGFYGNGYLIIDNNGEIIKQKNKPIFYNHEGVATEIEGGSYGKVFFNNEYQDYLLAFTSKSENTSLTLNINDTIVKEFTNTNYEIYNHNSETRIIRYNFKQYTSFIKDKQNTFFHQSNLTYNENESVNINFQNSLFKIFKVSDSYIKVDDNEIWLLNDVFKNQKLILEFDDLDIVNTFITDLKEIEGNLWINTAQNGVIKIPNYKNPSTYNYKIKDNAISGIIKKNDSIFLLPESKTHNYYIDGDLSLKLNPNLIKYNQQEKYNNTFYGLVHHIYDSESKVKSIVNNSTLYLANRQFIQKLNNQNELINITWSGSTIFSLTSYKDTLLVGTQNGIQYLTKDNVLKDYNTPGINLKDHRIQDLKVIDDKLIIATRGNGVIIISKNKINTISDENELASNIINHLFVDKNNNLWVATNRGVNLISFDKVGNYRFERIIDANQGILSPDIRHIYLNDSIIYLANDLGLSVVNLNKLRSNESYIPVYYKEIIFNDDSYAKNQLNDTTLQYSQNSILFRYTGVSTDYQHDITYRYKLEGLEKDWKYSKDRYIRYNSLKPGKYTFIVQARNAHNNWSKIHPETKITITRPIWRSPVLLTFIIFCTVLLSYITIAYYFINERKQNKLQRDLNKIKQKSLNAQMNPHFIYNSLNSIQSYILKNDKKLANKYLVKFANLMRLTFENSQNHYVSLEKELKALSLYLELEQMRFDPPFTYNLEIDSEINQALLKIPTLIIQPFVENAIWHGINQKEIENGHINITLKKEDDKLVITIEDNGVGIDLQKKKSRKNHTSSGIEISKKRLNLVNELSNVNYKCEIINLNNELKKQRGTLVKFTLPYTLNLNENN